MSAAELLRTARLSAGFTQRELSARSAIPQPRIAEIESCTHGTSVERLSSLLNVLGYRLAPIPTTSKGVWEQAVEIKQCLENQSEEVAWRRFIQLSDDLHNANSAIRVSLCVTEPLTTQDPGFDALLAGLAEYWLGKDSLPIPEWINTPSRFLLEPWDVEPVEALKAKARSQTPPAFLRHGIYLAWSEIASL
jgi:transcriptional regulator with XRE-family HTH domain